MTGSSRVVDEVGVATEHPHDPQNFAPSLTTLPQCGQTMFVIDTDENVLVLQKEKPSRYPRRLFVF